MVVNYCIFSCYPSKEAISYQAVIMAFLFLLQVIGIFLAFQTRKVKVKVLNDAKQVTAIVYVTSVCVVLIIMTTFALEEYLNVSSALFCFSMSIASSAFLILIFVPKVILSLSPSLSLSLYNYSSLTCSLPISTEFTVLPVHVLFSSMH